MKNKRWYILPIIVIILFCSLGALFGVNAQVWDGSTASSFASGSGTKSNPYVIETADQLAYLAQSVNSSRSYSEAYFVLENDIVLNDESFVFDVDTGLVKVSDGVNTAYLGTGIKGDGSKGNTVFDTVASEVGAWYANDTSKTKGAYTGTLNTWTPIGTKTRQFEGNFDGKDHTVSGIYVNTTLDYGGLFGCTNALLENIKVENSYIHAGEFAGALAGSNLYRTKGAVAKATVCSDKNNVGGVIGMGGTVTESFSACIVRGANNVGGVGGNAKAEKCCNTRAVLGNVNVGGIVGTGQALNSFNNASVLGQESVGGVCGYINGQSHVLTASYNIGTVYGEKYVGSILGRHAQGTVTKCYYLKGSASDNSNKIQNGFGTEATGSSRSDYPEMSCALDELQIKRKESFEGFDFEGVWIMSDGAPILISLKDAMHTHVYDNACDADCNTCSDSRATAHSYKTEWSSDKTSHWHECSVCFNKKDHENHKAGASATETTPQTCTVCSYEITPALGHTHNYSNAWSSDGTSHWHACSCGDKRDIATHRYDNSCDATCNDCQYVRTITHSYKTEWSSDKTSHWHECSVCFNKKDHENHKAGASATETTPQTCTVCSYEITPALGHTHSYSNAWLSDETSHWHACSCGAKRDIATHRYDNSCDATCNDCRYVRAITHSYKTEWSSDKTSHWHECSVCSLKKDSGNHKYDNACDMTCNDCAYVRTITHSYKTEWSTDKNSHWHECSVCSLRKDSENHEYDNACDTTCNDCAYVRTITHSYKTEWSTDKNSHWHECSVCSHKKDEANHKAGAAATETTPQTCTVCSYVITPMIGHTHSYVDTWSHDSTNHWHECPCGDKGDIKQHKYDNGCDTDCNECAYKRTVKHTYTDDKKYDDKSHWLECSVCLNKDQSEIHVFDNLCDTACNGCGYTRKITHVYDDKWSSDAGQHWHECVLCKASSEKEQHTFDGGTVTKQPSNSEEGIKTYKCSACSFTKNEPIAKLPPVGTDALTTTNTPITTVPNTTSGDTADTTTASGALSGDIDTTTSVKTPQTTPNTKPSDKVNTEPVDSDHSGHDGYLILTVVLGIVSVILLVVLIVMMLYFFKKKQ